MPDPSPALQIVPLDPADSQALESAAALLVAAFNDPKRYDIERMQTEIQAIAPPFYRQFFIARLDGELVGVGGVKAADWASNTHVLYLSAVAEHARGRGMARALVPLDGRLSSCPGSASSGCGRVPRSR